MPRGMLEATNGEKGQMLISESETAVVKRGVLQTMKAF